LLCTKHDSEQNTYELTIHQNLLYWLMMTVAYWRMVRQPVKQTKHHFVRTPNERTNKLYIITSFHKSLMVKASRWQNSIWQVKITLSTWTNIWLIFTNIRIVQPHKSFSDSSLDMVNAEKNIKVSVQVKQDSIFNCSNFKSTKSEIQKCQILYIYSWESLQICIVS
jgi:hypothetical protein